MPILLSVLLFQLVAMARRGKRRKLHLLQRSRSAPAVFFRHSPVKRRKQWTNIQMEKAMEAVKTGTGINRATMECGVPRTTLKDRMSGHVEHGINPGPLPYLNKEEEKELAVFLKKCASIGYGKTRKQVLAFVESYITNNKKGLKSSKITQGWWRNFLERQKDLSLRRGDNTSQDRMDAINSETIEHYFALLKKTLEENNLKNSPQRIYNVDESGVPLDPKGLSIVAESGSRKVRVRSTGRKGQVTVVACGNASGQFIPLMLIFDAKKLCPAWTRAEVPGTTYGLSDKGWITTELFESWLKEHFLEHAVAARPLLLLLDGHSTHFQPQLIRMARQKGVIILCLPPHTTHEAQPLDCGVFSPLKMQWRIVCHQFLQSNPGKVITKFNFNSLFSKAWLNAVTLGNVIGGFKTCGVYPFNSCAIRISMDTNIHDSVNNNLSAASGNSRYKDKGTIVTTSDKPPELTDEQEQLYQKRYDEGYNLTVDTEYLRWLEFHHPDSSLLCNSSSTREDSTSGFIDTGTTLTTGSKPPEFIDEQEQLYQKRYDEGYNLTVDAEYLRWLEFHHPDSSLLCNSSSTREDSTSSFRDTGTTLTTGRSKPPGFTDEQEQLYQKRYDEGYNLTVDSEYLQWLKSHHPDSSLISDCLSEGEMALSEYFSDVTPLEPIEMQGLSSLI